MGLGSASSVTLSSAREKAAVAMRALEAGQNPIVERKRTGGIPTFGELADEVIASLVLGFRSQTHKAQWTSSLATHAAPLRPVPVDVVATDDILAVLKPIWIEKAETASRVRGRIEKVLDAAKAKGFRAGENPARWRGHLDHLLPKQNTPARHHAAMPYEQVPSFIANLRERDALAAVALELCILTAARSGELRGMRWSEIDFQPAVWSLPAERMKAGRPHRVPLSTRAVAILRELKKSKRGEFVFAGRTPGEPLSPTAMKAGLRRMKVEVTVHGFRSSFRDWAGNETPTPREIVETALAHAVGDTTEQAYRRSDALEKRRQLMEAWADYCTAAPAQKIVPFRKRAQGGDGE
jgi:integrase